MDILKRSIAPISDDAWKEIDERAKEVLKSILTTRKVLKVNGPKGWEFAAVPEGRLEYIEDNKEGVCTGSYKLKKLVEARKSFTLNKWELDNVGRGAKDIDLGPLEEAVRELALFEENALYNGYKKGEILGLVEMAEHRMKVEGEGNEILRQLGDGVEALKNSYAQGPYDLVVSRELYSKLNVIFAGIFLLKAAEEVIGGKVIPSEVLDGALLLPRRNGEVEFTLGQDFAIGYENEDNKSVTLFITESFTLRVLDPETIVYFKE